MSKLISDLTLEEQMEIAKRPIKDDEFKKLPPARRFVMSEGIESGKEKIPAMLVYDRYVKWANAYKLKAVSTPAFFKELAKYFDKTRITNGYAYLMSPKGFNLSPEYFQTLQETNARKRISSNGNKAKKERSTKVTRKTTSTEKP